MNRQPVEFCMTVSELCLRAADDTPLSSHERALVDTHLADCTQCRQEQALHGVAASALRSMAVAEPDPARRSRLRRAVAQRRGPWRLNRWLTTPVPAYGAVAASLIVFALAGAFGGAHQTLATTPMMSSLAAVADTSLPTPVLTRADSYNVLANVLLLKRVLPVMPLLTDTLDRAAGTQSN